MDIKRITKKYYEQFHDHNLITLMKKDQFLEKHNLPKLTQGEKDKYKFIVGNFIKLFLVTL